ncbi:MAG: carboxypeptidase-like regulatory domain-containing protein [Bryobacterales bacterium]|nr:carboxypeptidase-like regulatory domain-containing protein [Bryobacteraceae bacterium]MDW8355099.1 carboxypeptidase-like regulatory domain-containing protein [Bryobacterales bacterium]
MVCPVAAAVIEGVVAEGATGRPLARARVVLEAAAGGPHRAYSDAQGRFLFTDLPAGVYFLTASKPGFAATRFGQRRWKGPGTPIVLEEGSRFVAELRLPRLAVISGQVTDENGVGLPDQQVLVYRRGPPLELVAHGRTDDRGVYRIAGLEPGLYCVRTAPIQLEDGTELLPTFFPNTLSLEESAVVEARLDAETTSVNITPLPGKLFRVTGTSWPGVRSVALYSDLGRRDASVNGDGSFLFDQLPPGSYELLAESSEGGRHLVSYRSFWLSGDLEGLHLEPNPAPTVSVRCEDLGGRRSEAAQVMVFVRRQRPPEASAARRVLCDGRETLTPGLWEIAVVTPPEVFVASISGESGKLEGSRFSLAPAQPFLLRILLSNAPAALRGRVTTADGRPVAGATVLLRPMDPSVAYRAAGKDAARTDADGNYLLAGLPPGTYRVFASLEARGPEEVNWETASAQTIELHESDNVILDLKLSSS